MTDLNATRRHGLVMGLNDNRGSFRLVSHVVQFSWEERDGTKAPDYIHTCLY